MMRLTLTLAMALVLPSLGACSSTGFSSSPASDGPPADFQVLLIGNSHSSDNDLPELLARLIEAGAPGSSAQTYAVPRWAFLAERLEDDVTQMSLEARDWTHVVLQAQKYSTSGKYVYPTTAAEEWIRRVRARNALPILFPEWARRGNDEEGARIYALHTSIAAKEPACVAPVGQAWQIAQARDPRLSLYATDGNHANRFGALLTAHVLAEAITGKPAGSLPDLDDLRIAPETQALLREAAAAAGNAHPACGSVAR